MFDSNPYSPPQHGTETTAVAHRLSLRAETWRGFKFGLKVTAIAMTLSMIGIAAGIFAAMTNGGGARFVEWRTVLWSLVGAFAAVAMMSLCGGFAGAIVMGIAGVVRILWHSTAALKTPGHE